MANTTYILHTQLVEYDRHRLLAVERLILETICFNFTTRMPFPYLIKIARAINGWRLLLYFFTPLILIFWQQAKNSRSFHGG